MQVSFRNLFWLHRGHLFLLRDKARYGPECGSFDHTCRTRVTFEWVRKVRSLWTSCQRSTKLAYRLLYSIWPQFQEAQAHPPLLNFPSLPTQHAHSAALPLPLNAFPQHSTQLLPPPPLLLIPHSPLTVFPSAFSWWSCPFLSWQLLLSLPISWQWVWFELESGCWPSFSIILINIYSTLQAIC